MGNSGGIIKPVSFPRNVGEVPEFAMLIIHQRLVCSGASVSFNEDNDHLRRSQESRLHRASPQVLLPPAGALISPPSA